MEEDKKIGKLKAVYTGAVQAGEVEIAEIIKDGINIIENLINRNKTLEKEIKLMKSVNLEDNYIPKSKVKELLSQAEERYQTYKKGVDENENLKFGTWRYLGQVQILKDLLGISRNIVTLDSEELLQEGDK